MRTISEIYKEYKIMPNLQEHMFRVASVASLICDTLDMKVEKDNIIKACLLHDIGSIVKFNLTHFPEFYEPEGLEYWQKIKDQYIKKYGTEEHHANLKIIKELGISTKVFDLADGVGHFNFCDQLDMEDFSFQIVNYADTRVSPFGVVSFKDRMEDVFVRYNFSGDEKHIALVECGKEIEKQIFAHCSIKPEDINDESIKPYMEKLKEFMV